MQVQVCVLCSVPNSNSLSPLANFSKAIGKFTREDPTLRVQTDAKTGETIMSGMGELHLDIYVERMKREYKVECITGEPNVNYKEAITKRGDFNYLHKKQSGGSGQYAKVIGYVEPLDDEEIAAGKDFIFENEVVGTNIPPEFIPSCEKGEYRCMCVCPVSCVLCPVSCVLCPVSRVPCDISPLITFLLAPS